MKINEKYIDKSEIICYIFATKSNQSKEIESNTKLSRGRRYRTTLGNFEAFA